MFFLTENRVRFSSKHIQQRVPGSRHISKPDNSTASKYFDLCGKYIFNLIYFFTTINGRISVLTDSKIAAWMFSEHYAYFSKKKKKKKKNENI